MCDHSIRRLTPDERDERRYEEIYGQVEDEERSEYEREFGPDPAYRACGRTIHILTQKRLDRERRERQLGRALGDED